MNNIILYQTNEHIFPDFYCIARFGDILNDQTQINNSFDSIIEIFSEPGIKKDFILNLNHKEKLVVFHPYFVEDGDGSKPSNR